MNIPPPATVTREMGGGACDVLASSMSAKQKLRPTTVPTAKPMRMQRKKLRENSSHLLVLVGVGAGLGEGVEPRRTVRVTICESFIPIRPRLLSANERVQTPAEVFGEKFP